jgi:uncharacterized membrane protein YphA (DoxX/SURF4 family)
MQKQSTGLLLLRIMVGWVFLSEGIQKFLYPATLGVGRFTKIGIPVPSIMAPFVGTVEIVCGTLLIVGLFTSLASVPLLGVISVAIATTKAPCFSSRASGQPCTKAAQTSACSSA